MQDDCFGRVSMVKRFVLKTVLVDNSQFYADKNPFHYLLLIDAEIYIFLAIK